MRSIRLPSWIERLLGTAPLPPPPDVFFLDERGLQHARVLHGPRGLVVDRYHSWPLPPESFTEGMLGGPLREPKVLWEILQDARRRLGDSLREATLVLPDDWMRLAFTEIEELPRQAKKREEVLRWKLKRLVPFRVDDLRVSAVETTPFPGQQEARRLLLGFAMESLVGQLEEAFQAIKVSLGRITNKSQALLAAVGKQTGREESAVLALVEAEGYSLSCLRRGEPVVYRHKIFTEEMGYAVRSVAAERDLRLLISYLREHFPDNQPSRAFLAAPEVQEGDWMGWLEAETGLQAEPLDYRHFSLARALPEMPLLAASPLLGAASLEVSWS